MNFFNIIASASNIGRFLQSLPTPAQATISITSIEDGRDFFINQDIVIKAEVIYEDPNFNNAPTMQITNLNTTGFNYNSI